MLQGEGLGWEDAGGAELLLPIADEGSSGDGAATPGAVVHSSGVQGDGSPKCTRLTPEGLPGTRLKQGSACGRLPLGKVPSGAGCSKNPPERCCTGRAGLKLALEPQNPTAAPTLAPLPPRPT